jgi:hypothetical protein
MPSKSRRLPGGKVRRPAARGRQAQPAPPPPAPSPSPEDGVSPAAEEQASWAGVAPAPAEGGAGNGAVTQRAPAAPATPAAPAPRRRGAVVTGTVAGGAARRAGPSSLDVAEASLTYVRTDLARILILAAVMIGIIVVLSFFVLR